MPVSCQTWEMASGPTIAYNLAGRTSGCAVVDSRKSPNFSILRVQDTMSRSSAESPICSNYRFSSSQVNVLHGFSALSLCGRSEPEADPPSEEDRSVSLGALCCSTPPELYRCMSPTSNEGSPARIAQSTGCWRPVNSSTSACNAGFVSTKEVCNHAYIAHMHSDATNDFSHVGFEVMSQGAPHNMAYHPTVPVGFPYEDEASEHGSLDSFSNMLRSSGSSLHATSMDTCKGENLELDTISESSFSSENGMPLANSLSFQEASQILDDSEAQSAYKETVSFSVGASSPPRKGLSKFYAGKSRSFSCLRDVVSVKDLAKEETPYVKKRRVNSSTSRLPPLQKSAASISKKPLQSGKSTLALAVAMNTKEDYEAQACARDQESAVPSRSYSLSDLEGAGRSLFFIG